MTLPKVTRFVRDGEVDPGVREMAEAIRRRIMYLDDGITPPGSISDILKRLGITSADAIRYWIEVTSWKLASQGLGVFGTSTFEDFDVNAVDGGVMNAWINHFEQYAEVAERLYRRVFSANPNLEMIVEALMFYDSSGAFAEMLDRGEASYEAGAYLAEATASGIPLLGRKWIVSELVRGGTPVMAAREQAYNVYDQGGNYLDFKRTYERTAEVAAILRAVDPEITDVEIARVVSSPLPVSVVRSTMGVEAQTEASSSSMVGGMIVPAALAAGAGWLAAGSFGGPVGVAVGAAIFLASTFFFGSKE